MEKLIPILGLLVFVALGYIFSKDRKNIQWRPVLGGFVLSFVLMMLMLKTSGGKLIFQTIGDMIMALIHFGNKGAEFVFGDLAHSQKTGFIFAFQVMPNIIFFTVLIGLGYHFRIIPKIITISGRVLSATLKVSGVQGVNAAANSLNGMIEGCLMVKKYVPKMNNSEIHAMMAIGLSTISSELTPALASLGIDLSLLLTSSVAAVPAAIAMANLLFPNPDRADKLDKVEIDHEEEKISVLEVIIKSAEEGLHIVLGIVATLIVFIGLIYTVDGLIEWVSSSFFGQKVNLSLILGTVFTPVVWLLGIEPKDLHTVGSLLGKKILFNEFVAYLDLLKVKVELSDRSVQITTVLLCSFSNIAACGISLGGYNKIFKRPEYSKYIVRALCSAILTSLVVSAMASLLF